jgi:hypothetical protein
MGYQGVSIMKEAFCSVIICGLLFVGADALHAAEAVQGMMTTDGVTGQDAKPHHWMKQNIYVAALDTGFGFGTPTSDNPAGWFRIAPEFQRGGFPGGTYALASLSFDGINAYACHMNLRIPEGEEVLDGTRLHTPAHCSVMFDKGYTEWDDSPWMWGSDFYQTFRATGTGVTRVATKLAGKSGDHYFMTLNFAIYEPNDGPPDSWKLISPVRSRFLSQGTDPIIHIFWVAYRSGEVKLTPGKTYAMRFWRDASSQSETFSMVVRKDTGDGYAHGHVWADGQERKDLDCHAHISGGARGTLCDYAPVTDQQLKTLIGSGKSHGQEFRAMGTGLAAVETIYATGDFRPPSHPVTFQLYDAPGGGPLGPRKTCYGFPLVSQARAMVVWDRGEVRLQPGDMYYIEWTSPDVNTWKLNEDVPGHAFVNGKPHEDADLALSIVEYVDDLGLTDEALDLNGDGTLDNQDARVMEECRRKADGSDLTEKCRGADLDQDGDVDDHDLRAFEGKMPRTRPA